ncbi:hypothetical protein [Cylindrospermopsis raciborskii]|uniref:hypothetical protein n=1 Tax=Cylindrospermopsis raciborskii TaxID=77022 RepID=UPI0022BC8D1C|nr:hypothetical protein [Cylindrospermopsis raciborskii]MCZ2207240.1 hypothetical protein [Cylindrospermopsis raciborskii PAMP2011]
MAGSDGRQRVKPECFDRYYILFPPSPILKDFDKIAKPIFKQIHFLTLQNQKLVEARDLLLPRLMNRWHHPYRHWLFKPEDFSIDPSKTKSSLKN